MYLPTHYAVAVFALLLCQSGLLFVYTLIGLIKQNPLPYLIPPPISQQASICAYSTPQNAAGADLQAPFLATVTHTNMATTTLYSTVYMDRNSAANIPVSNNAPKSSNASSADSVTTGLLGTSAEASSPDQTSTVTPTSTVAPIPTVLPESTVTSVKIVKSTLSIAPVTPPVVRVTETATLSPTSTKA